MRSPSVAHLKGLFVACGNAACQCWAPFAFAALGVANELAFHDLAGALRPLD